MRHQHFCTKYQFGCKVLKSKILKGEKRSFNECQKLGLIEENEVVQKLKLENNIFNIHCVVEVLSTNLQEQIRNGILLP